MKTKNKFFLIIVLLLLLVNGYYYIIPMFSSTEKNLENEIAALSLTANDLVGNYTNDEENSNKLYAGKIIEISGTVKEITFLNDRTTVILKSNSEQFGVICDINPNQKENINKLKQDQKITIKGICKGFLKDVILLNCTIYLPTNE
jgi:uncharacterized protein (UPF0333 family)